jgi:hypothetical protein
MSAEPNVFNLINIITRQTDYDNDTALDKLQEHCYDPIAVIRDFMAPKSTKPKINPTPNPCENKTTNQKVYQEMRYMLDAANASYRKKKELEEELENATNR